MKKGLLTAFILILIASLFSCSDAYDETVISDIELYDTI